MLANTRTFIERMSSQLFSAFLKVFTFIFASHLIRWWVPLNSQAESRTFFFALYYIAIQQSFVEEVQPALHIIISSQNLCFLFSSISKLMQLHRSIICKTSSLSWTRLRLCCLCSTSVTKIQMSVSDHTVRWGICEWQLNSFSYFQPVIRILRFSDRIGSNSTSQFWRRSESSKASDHFHSTFFSLVDRILHVSGGYQLERKASRLS
jgi:hypothetical protein